MIEKIQALLERQEKEDDSFSLWNIISAVERYLLPKDAPPSALQPAPLGYIRVMLENGFLAVNPRDQNIVPYGAWANQNPDYVINRIQTEWNALGREPNIGDIVWFFKPKQN